MATISSQVSRGFAQKIRIAAALMDISKSEFIRAALEEKLTHMASKVDVEIRQQEVQSIEENSHAPHKTGE